MVLAFSCVFGIAGPSNAEGLCLDSVTCQPANVVMLAEAGMTTMNVPASAEVTSYAASQAASTAGLSSTVSGASAGGSSGVPWVSQAVNTLGVLGGLVGLHWLGGDSNKLPAGSAQTFTRSGCGYVYGTVVIGACSANSVTVTVTNVSHYGYVGAYQNGPTYNTTSPTGVYPYLRYYTSNCTTSCNFASLERPGATQTDPAYTWRFFGATSSANLSDPAKRFDLGTAQVERYTTTMADPSISADPTTVDHHVESTAKCTKPDGTVQTVTGSGSTFRVGSDGSATIGALPDVTCPAGSYLSSGTRVIKTDGQPDVPLTEPYTAPDWVGQQVTDFPECLPVGTVACQLELVKIGTSTHPDYRCHEYGVGTGNPCYDWYTDPLKSQKYECMFGTHVLPHLRRCDPYRSAFTTGAVTATPTDPDTDPAAVEVPDPTPEQTPNLGDCTPSWSSMLSPWWVYKATTCALKWAFVPQTALSTRADGIKLDLDGKAPFSWFGGMAALPAAVPDNGCPDWTIKVAGKTTNVVCDSSYTAMIRSSRPVLTAFMVTLALWPLIRSTAYAAFPIIKPAPGMLR